MHALSSERVFFNYEKKTFTKTVTPQFDATTGIQLTASALI